MKITVLALMIALLLVSSAFSIISAESGYTMPISAPPPDAQAPKVSILYPSNNTVFQSGNFSLSFTASCISNYTIIAARYVDNWQPPNTLVYDQNAPDYHGMPQYIDQGNLSRNITLTNIPEGNHTIVVTANAYGYYLNTTIRFDSNGFPEGPVGYSFYINGSSSINFIVDKVLPTVSFIPNQNLTYQNGNVTLSFLLNKPAQVIYNLDNEGNMTATGNSTLAFNNLPYGKHSVTIYSKDNYGVFSAPSTISLNVQKSEPFPTLTVAIVASILVVVGISIGLLLYRRHQQVKKL